MRVLLFISFLFIFRVSFADTTWLDKRFRSCPETSATYFSLVEPKAGLYNRRLFYAANKALYNETTFRDPKLLVKFGLSRSYNTAGELIDSVIYYNGIPLYFSVFHDNGKKKTVLVRDTSGVSNYVNSWDREGNELFLDTFYHDSRGRDCHKDTAFSKGIINKEDSVWRLRFYHVSNDSLYTTGYFKERLCKTRCRYGSWYQQGVLWDSLLYGENGKKKEAWYYFRGGKKNAHQLYNAAGWITSAENWDESGNVIKPDTLFKWPLPVEGYKTWEKNIIRKINNDETIDPKRRRDLYGNVHLRFRISEDGLLEYVHILEPSIYPDMDNMILKAFAETKSWKPATRHGRKQAYLGRKVFSFVSGIVIKAKDMYY
jgi:TonB family protein